MLWQILVHFLFRLSLGLALAMFLTSARQVTAGFFRVHLWVALGLSTFAAAVVLMVPDFPAQRLIAGIAAAAAVTSYVGAVVWLYERSLIGRGLLAAVAVVNLVGDLALEAAVRSTERAAAIAPAWLAALDSVTSAVLLGATFTAMLLGHWYLNTPSMKLAPLQKLVVLMAGAVLVRAAVASGDLQHLAALIAARESTELALLALRWLAGLIGVLLMAALTWQTLKIPNTQSATGILYVAVIFVFLGELTAQLLVASPVTASG